MPLVFALLPFFSTALGGVVALRLRHRLHPIMAFAAGVLVATALADLLPEALEMAGEAFHVGVSVAAVIGFLLFTVLESIVHRQSWEHQHPETVEPDRPHEHPNEGHLVSRSFSFIAATGLILHSMLDGLAIGLGFRADLELGYLVLLAVITHDFADGMNVVTLALRGSKVLAVAISFLILDALAPVVGAVFGSMVPLSPEVFGLLLGGFAGVFIAIGAGHLLPEAQHGRPGSAALLSLTVLGALLVVAIRLVVPI